MYMFVLVVGAKGRRHASRWRGGTGSTSTSQNEANKAKNAKTTNQMMQVVGTDAYTMVMIQ